MDEKKLRDLIVRSDRWKQQAMQGQRATITAGEAKLVRQALEYALELMQEKPVNVTLNITPKEDEIVDLVETDIPVVRADKHPRARKA